MSARESWPCPAKTVLAYVTVRLFAWGPVKLQVGKHHDDGRNLEHAMAFRIAHGKGYPDVIGTCSMMSSPKPCRPGIAFG